MHIHEGFLSETLVGNVVLGAGALLAAAGTAKGLRHIRDEDVPRVAMLSAAFFAISAVAIPVGPGTTHLLLNGLMGVLLGWAVFPAVLVALLLQFFAFSAGGLTTLGLNTLVMATPGVVCHYAYRGMIRRPHMHVAFVGGLLTGVTGVAGSLLIFSGATAVAGFGFLLASSLHAMTNLALLPIEAMVTASAVVFLRRVRPELLTGTAARWSDAIDCGAGTSFDP